MAKYTTLEIRLLQLDAKRLRALESTKTRHPKLIANFIALKIQRLKKQNGYK